jgi:hypothetical protein
MEVVPLSVGAASRAWDEQHNDVAAAAGQVGGAPTSGFTESVSGAASRFASTWQRHTDGLADEAEGRADALRQVIADFLATDQAVGADVLGLVGYLTEQR